MNMAVHTINIDDIEEYINMNTVIIDLRNSREYQEGHIKGACNIRFDTDMNTAEFIKKEIVKYRGKRLLLYCERGNSSLMLANILSEKGYNAISLYGGIKEYKGRLVKSANK